ncbi:MAG TPA: CHRD domain-containing protein [Dehalococcoidia bacterium]|nr:CHRD domain-containing protein [Dehalococcoidia bacterium]
MKPRILILSLVTLLSIVSTAAIVSAHEVRHEDRQEDRNEDRHFKARLSGDEEVPAVDTDARGRAKFKLSKDGDELDFRLRASKIEDVTAAHIHCGPEGVNGPVAVFLYSGPVVTPHGILSEGTLTAANLIALPDSPACPGGISTFDDLIAKMRSGGAYVNVHTTANPGGEIRGQVH